MITYHDNIFHKYGVQSWELMQLTANKSVSSSSSPVGKNVARSNIWQAHVHNTIGNKVSVDTLASKSAPLSAESQNTLHLLWDISKTRQALIYTTQTNIRRELGSTNQVNEYSLNHIYTTDLFTVNLQARVSIGD